MDETQVADVQATESAPVVETEIQEVETPVETESKAETPPAAQEKMIPASHVSKIAAREAKQAAEKARQEAWADFQRQQMKPEQQETEPASSMGGMPNIPPEMFQEQLIQAARHLSVQMSADQMAKDFESKIEAEIHSDPDFGDLYDSLNINQHPELVIWMNGMDNSAKVVKDLAQNPAKFANILMLAKSGLGSLAKNELVKLSESIKVNQAAQAQPKVKEPLDQLSPSNVGVGNGDDLSVSDFMKMDWLRG